MPASARSSWFFVAALAVFSTSPGVAAAQGNVAGADGVVPLRTERLADGVWALLRDPGVHPSSVASSVLVVGSEAALLVDTGDTPAAGARIAATVEALTHLPVRWIVNTHHHGDHVNGNGALRDRYIGAALVAHPGTQAVMMASGESLPPDTVVPDRLVVDLGGREVVLVHPGPAHTVGDLVVHVPDVGVVAVGDLLEDGGLWLEGADVVGWATALERVAALDGDIVVPSHGDPRSDRSLLEAEGSLLRTAVEAARRAHGRGVEVDEVARRVVPGLWEEHGPAMGAEQEAFEALFESAARAAFAQLRPDTLFADDFEGGLGRWSFPMGEGAEAVSSGDAERGSVMALRTRALPAYGLMRGSESWGDVRVTGKMMFPDDGQSYLGFIYRYVDDGRRIDFGGLYVKGNDSYVQANPRFDTNVARTVYPEFRAPLTGGAAVRIGAWVDFALEVVGSEAHLYVGSAPEPVMTLPFGSGEAGAFGFEARNPGAAVWIDDVSVEPMTELSWQGEGRPDIQWSPASWATEWSVLGPLARMHTEVERGSVGLDDTVVDDGRAVGWRPFPTDARGAVVTGTVTEHRRERRVAYFRTVVEGGGGGPGFLEISTVDDVALWLNGAFLGFAARQDAAWWDAARGEAHEPVVARVVLRPGPNEVLVRVVGGVYATGGFFLRARR